MSFSKRKYIKAGAVLISLVLIIFLTILVSGYFSLRDMSKYSIVTAFVLGFFYNPLSRRMNCWMERILLDPIVDTKGKELKSSRKGFEGENKVNAWLEEIVGKESFFKNVSFYGCNFDIDNVVVCSRGVFAIEVKNLANPMYFTDENCFYEGDDGERRPSLYEDPRFETRRHANALRNYLSGHGLGSVKVIGLLVFPNGKVSWEGKTGVFITRGKKDLEKCIKGGCADKNCTPEICNKIKELLRKV